MKPASLRLVIILAAALVAACGSDKRGVSPAGPTESGGIVVESTTLKAEQPGTCCDPPSCRIEGSIRNNTTTPRKVTLIFNAFDGKGQRLGCFFGDCTIRAKNTSGGDLVVRAAGRDGYRAQVFQFQNCDAVARVEIVELTSEPA